MNKLLTKLRVTTTKGKYLYMFLIIIFFIGVIFGSIFITILDEPDKTSVLNQITAFFNQIDKNQIDYMGTLKNSMTSNLIFVLLIWILGISIIGIPIIIVMIFLKGFMIGFSMVSIIVQYKFAGVLGSLSYIFPHIIISVVVIIVMSFYALRLSFNLFKAVAQKKSINFSEVINRYTLIMVISIIIMVIASLIETFISPYIIKFFLLFI